ncbi:MAG: DUF4831 family protein [Rikenellaceae bacterium]
MNKYFIALIASLSSLGLFAQEIKSEGVGLFHEDGGYTLSYPTTSILVKLLVEKEVVTPGVYARYAQKFLSLRAPLTSQTNYKIVDASISAIAGDNSEAELVAMPSQTHYTSLPVDQYSSEVAAMEIAARDAAAAIFTIRRQRRDIINGEAGEGYFGAGLEDAMSRLDKMEQEYIELFTGSRTVVQSVKSIVFTPAADSPMYVIARFDPKGGVLPTTDLAGVPVYMQFVVNELPNTLDVEAIKSSPKNIKIRVAASTQCILYNDSEEITSSILPIYEFGKTIQVEPSTIR